MMTKIYDAIWRPKAPIKLTVFVGWRRCVYTYVLLKPGPRFNIKAMFVDSHYKNETVVKPTCLMMTSPNGNIFRVTGPLCGEFIGHRWISLTKASDLRLNKRFSKQSWGWWFEMSLCPLWRHCNVLYVETGSCLLLISRICFEKLLCLWMFLRTKILVKISGYARLAGK